MTQFKRTNLMGNVRIVGTVKSEPVTGLPPGMVRRRLLAPVIDDNGTTWPAGTEYVPLHGGMDNTIGERYLVIKPET